MTGVLILLLAAAVGFTVARVMRLPAVPLLVLSGVVASALGGLAEEAFVQDALVFGVAFLLFAAGTELDAVRIGAQRTVAAKVAVAQLVLVAAAGAGASFLLGLEPLAALYVALALSASSTLVVVRLLRQRQQAFEPFGRVVLGVLLLQDLAVVIAAPLLDRFPQGPVAMLTGLGLTLGLAALAWAVSRWVAPAVFVDANLDPESLLLTALAVLFAFVGLAWLLELPAISGAFLAGTALSRFPVGGILRSQLSSLGDFFLAVFLVALGASLALPTLDELILAGALVAVVVLLTPPLVTLIAERAGLSTRSAIEAGLLLAQTSELSLVIALLGHEHGHVDEGLVRVIVIVTLVTMALTPILTTRPLVRCLLVWHPFRRRADPLPQRDHVVVLGCGTATVPVVRHLVASGVPTVVVDEDPNALARAEGLGAQVLRGDGSDPEVLDAAGVPHARATVSTLRRLADNEAVLALGEAGPVLVRVFEPSEAEWVRARGGEAILTSAAARDAVLDWLDG